MIDWWTAAKPGLIQPDSVPASLEQLEQFIREVQRAWQSGLRGKNVHDVLSTRPKIAARPSPPLASSPAPATAPSPLPRASSVQSSIKLRCGCGPDAPSSRRSSRTLRFEVDLPANHLGPGWKRTRSG